MAEEIHVISAVVIPRSRPIKLEMTVTDPVSKAPMAMAIVAVSTKSTSCTVEEKHAGRTLFVVTGSRGLPSSPPSVSEVGAWWVATARFSSTLSASDILAVVYREQQQSSLMVKQRSMMSRRRTNCRRLNGLDVLVLEKWVQI